MNGVTTKYTLFGDKVAFETTGSDKIHYSYDASGNLFSMNLNGSEYYYTRNAQGDITGLIDGAKNQVVSYTYDTWGKLLSTTGSLAGTLGVKNPYRYRGYRYDTETGLYYLQSRYYNPDWGRFVNADAAIGQIGNIQGHNMFQYCFNNPVNMDDPSGHWPLSTILTAVAVVATVVAVAAVVVATVGAAAPAFALAGGAALGGTSGGVAGAIAGVAFATAKTAAIGAAIAKTAEIVSDKSSRRDHIVYKLTDASGTPQYIGRTKNAKARKLAHNSPGSKTAGLEFEPIATNLTHYEARGLEQIAMLEYNTKNYLNSINGISPSNSRRDIYMAAGRQTAHYIGNQISNEVLYWTGK